MTGKPVKGGLMSWDIVSLVTSD